jgi:DNA polymerase-3 subunit beta
MIKLTIEREKILNPLSKVMGVTERKSLMPYLSNVLIRFGRKSEVYATDLDVCAIAKIDYELEEEFSIVVNARKLHDVLREFNKGNVDMEMRENGLKLSQEKTEFILALYDPDEFPERRELNAQVTFSIDGHDLLDLFDSVSFAVGTDEERYILTGILMRGDEGGLVAVGTDGYRMAVRRLERRDLPTFTSFVLPSKTVRELEKVVEPEHMVVLGVGQGGVSFSTEEARIISRVIDGQYPDYEGAIPRHNRCVFKVEREGLLKALKRVSAIMSRNEPLHLSLWAGNLEISAEGEEGRAKEVLPVHYEDEKKDLNFNGKFLLEAISHTRGDLLKFSLPDTYGAVLIEEEGGRDYINVIMPIKV